MKTINITTIDIHEIQFSKNGESYSINVLFSQKGDDGKEYAREWTSFKNKELPNGIETFLDTIFAKVQTKIMHLENITN